MATSTEKSLAFSMVIHRTNTSRLLWNDSFTQIKHQVVVFLVIMICSCTMMDAMKALVASFGNESWKNSEILF